jgi:hypothetical protein
MNAHVLTRLYMPGHGLAVYRANDCINEAQMGQAQMEKAGFLALPFYSLVIGEAVYFLTSPHQGRQECRGDTTGRASVTY